MQKQVKIVGLSVAKSFGGLKAVDLEFNEENRLTLIKGEVGSGKTTLNRAMRLTTQGSGVLTDKNLYGDIDITTQLSDGDMSIFVGCRTDIKTGSLNYFLYGIDKDGNKVKDVVLDGQRATPASYLKSLQTALTWRLDELTSENPTTQRNILLELYQKELEEQGVIYNKNHPKYTESIIHKIELAKNHRAHMDMKRKEVGGIADDMTKKGIIFTDRRKIKDTEQLQKTVNTIDAKITLAQTNLEQTRDAKLTKLKLEGSELVSKARDINSKIYAFNDLLKKKQKAIQDIKDSVKILYNDADDYERVLKVVLSHLPKVEGQKTLKGISFASDGKIVSKPKDFENEDQEVFKLLKKYKKIKQSYKDLEDSELKIDNTDLIAELEEAKAQLESAKNYNKTALAVNSYHDWADANETVNDIKKDYFLKLTEIDTGVEGLYICTDQNAEEDENIYLMYDGTYDPKYFNNKNKELRKISAYSGTQKPMICLLIQNYLLSQKNKTLPYLWIDDVPIDQKTRELLEKMAKELNLWLFVNWTGDFKASQLKDGEILLENGEILMKD
jgi:hypothetical protein